MKKLIILTMLCPFLSMCQSITIHGKIINEKMEPIEGATITLKKPNSNNLTKDTHTLASDSKGEFTLYDVMLNDTIIISAIGYLSETQVLDYPLPGTITFVLKEKNKLLNEVIINTGYQQLPKERSTGSFSHIPKSLFNQQVSSDILSRLESITPGLAIDRNTSGGGIMIRGLSTINGPRQPLIILDNFPYAGDISNIHPSTVESITILKDAAAASIWGARAGNGVIVITTKKSRLGQPLSIEFQANSTIIAKPDLFYLKQMSSSEYMEAEKFLYSNGFFTNALSTPWGTALSPVIELLNQQTAGTISPEAVNAQLKTFAAKDVRNDFNHYIYKPGINQQYVITAEGGSASSAWLLSAAYDRNKDNLSDLYKRTSFKVQNTLKPHQHIRIQTSMQFTGSQTTSGRQGWTEMNANNHIYPYSILATPGGNPLSVAKTWRDPYTDTVGGGKLLSWKYYPLQDFNHVTNTIQLQDIILDGNLQYNVIKGLRADVSYQYEKQSSTGELMNDEESFYTRDLVNRFTQVNPLTGAVSYKLPKGAIVDNTLISTLAHNFRAGLAWTKTGRNSLNALAGAEIRQINTNFQRFRTYGFDRNIGTSVNVDLVNTFPNYVTGATEFIPSVNAYAENLNRFVSLYANGAYTFQSKYTVSFSARRDASNLFGVKTNNRWKPLWSAGLGWDASKENFYKLSFLPYLKIRATYGYSGNADPNSTAFTTIDYLSASPYTGSPYARFAAYANPELRWEKVNTLNLGLDFATNNNTISGSIEYYRKKGLDLLGTYPVDYTAGVGTTVMKNVAGMKGYGWDIMINSMNIKKPVQWSTDFNLTIYHDKVLEYYLPSLAAKNFIAGNNFVSGINGKPVYALYAYRWANLDPATGDPLGFLNGTVSNDYNELTGNSILVDQLAYYGPVIPPVYGSMGNTLSWKHLSLTVRVMYKLGYFFRRNSINYSDLFNNGRGHEDFAIRWQKPGDERITNVPSLVYPNPGNRDVFYSGAEPLITKGDHVRLQYINLGYSFPVKATSAFKELGLFTTISNLGLLWKANKEGLDPEYSNTLLPPKQLALSLKAIF